MVRVYRLHGPPGCGKTTALATAWVPRAVEKYGADRVVCCSLTRAAATELASRVDLPRENVGTLHALAYRALGRPVIAEKKLAEWNASNHAKGYALDPGADVDVNDPWESRGISAGDFLGRAGILRHRLVPLDSPEWGTGDGGARGFMRRWRAWLDETGYLDFTGLLEACLERRIPCPAGHSLIVVDEAQDCSRLEVALVRWWAHDADGLVLVGDSLQAIYEWRGADSGAFLDVEVAPEDERELRQSYRLPATVHAVSVAIARQMTAGHLVDFAPRLLPDGTPAPGAVVRSAASYRDADGIVREIDAALAAEPGRVMVLASCGYMLNGLLRALREAGTPIDHPWRRHRGDWNPLAGAARRLVAWLAGGSRDWTWHELSLWLDHCSADGLLVRGGKGQVGLRGDDDATADQPVTPGDLAGLFLPGEAARLLLAVESADTGWLAARLLDSQRKAWTYPLAVYKRHGLAGLVDEPRITVGTVHSVKGAEASTVILLPDLSAKAARAWHDGDAERDAVLRTFYVGVTRARERLVLCEPAGRDAYRWPNTDQPVARANDPALVRLDGASHEA